MLKRIKTRLKPVDIAKKLGDKAVEVQGSSSKHVGRYLTKRSGRMQESRRFTAGWLALAALLLASTAYAAWNLNEKATVRAGDSGGTYRQGLVGEINNLNPIFTTSKADASAQKLLFNGLLRYNENGELVPDLASSFKVEKDNKTYSFTLRKDVYWHDGQPFTAQDVLFTIQTIQDPAARSPLFANWQDVRVKSAGQHSVQFVLAAPTASFPSNFTTAILPAHLLEDIVPATLRTTEYNSLPIGTGPFEMRVLRSTAESQQLELARNESYYRQAPRVERFVLAAFNEEEDLVKALSEREITAAIDLSNEAVKNLGASSAIRTDQLPIRSGVFSFFKTTVSPLNDTGVRQALVLGFDRAPLLDLFETRYRPMKTPILPGQYGYNQKYNQQTNKKRAAQLLEKAGWKLKNGVRTKGDKQLELKLVTVNSAEYTLMSAELQRQWREIGVVLKPELLAQEQFEQNALTSHDYDVLLYGISLGADPDVYPYWHSSQARPGSLNFSQWSSARADVNLEIGRTRLQPVLRSARYADFLDEWQKQAPALALYQPRISYSYHQNAKGIKVFPINAQAEQLTNVEDWTVNTRSVLPTP